MSIYRINYRHKMMLTSLLLFSLLFYLGGSARAEAEDNGPGLPAGVHITAPDTPIRAEISLDRLPKVGESAELTCMVQSLMPADNVQLSLDVSAGTQRTGTPLASSFSLLTNEATSRTTTIQFPEVGEYTLACRAITTISEAESWGDLAELHLTVGDSASFWGFAPVPLHESRAIGRELEPGDGDLRADSLHASGPADITLRGEAPTVIPAAAEVTPGVVEAAGALTVTGRWGYYDRDDDYTPALEFIVELVRGDNGNHLDWCYTNTNGYYSCGPVTNPGAAGVRTVVHSYTNYNPHGDRLVTVNPDWGTSNSVNNAFSVQTGVRVFGDGTHDIGSWVVINGSSYERAFWIQNDLNRTWRFIWFQTGSSQSPQETGGPGTVEWKLSSTDGTYYSLGGNIHLAGADPLSTTVVAHEYGHNIMYNVYGGWWPAVTNCNPHWIQLNSSTTCAWTEGFANFISIVVNNIPVYTWASGASLNLETPTWGTAGWHSGDDVEGRVAGSLWDIWDSSNENNDQLNIGFDEIWDVVYHQNDSTFSAFWSAWRSRGHPNNSAGPIMALYQNTIDYRLGPSNDDFAAATNVGPATFVNNLNTSNATTQGLDPDTPCGSSNPDYQSRSVWYRHTPGTTRNYDINTNGSSYDTVLAVWTGSANALSNQACDDDAGIGFDSALQLTMFAGTTYYIEVMSYGDGPGGFMDLSIAVDNSDPTGTVWINGNAPYATSPSVTLTTPAIGGGNGVKEVRIRNGLGSWSGWMPHATTQNWTLPVGDGAKTVFVQYRDYANHVSPIYSDSITLDTAAPTTTVTSPATVQGLAFQVNWNASDNMTGVIHYDVQYRLGESGFWVNWYVDTAATSATFGPNSPMVTAPGDIIHFRVRAEDAAGNVEIFTSGEGDSTTVILRPIYLPIISMP